MTRGDWKLWTIGNLEIWKVNRIVHTMLLPTRAYRKIDILETGFLIIILPENRKTLKRHGLLAFGWKYINSTSPIQTVIFSRHYWILSVNYLIFEMIISIAVFDLLVPVLHLQEFWLQRLALDTVENLHLIVEDPTIWMLTVETQQVSEFTMQAVDRGCASLKRKNIQ